MKSIIITALFLVTYTLNAQEHEPCGCIEETEFEPKLTGSTFIPPIGVTNKTFINSLALPADIYLITGEKKSNVNIIYNGYIDEILWQEDRKFTLVQLDKELISGFRFHKFNGEENAEFKKIQIKKAKMIDSTYVFAQLIYAGKISLYAYHHIYVYNIQKYYSNKGEMYDKMEFQPGLSYYIQMPDKKTLELKKIKKKHLLSLFPDKKAELTERIKTLKTGRLRNKEDLVKIVEILNTIY